MPAPRGFLGNHGLLGDGSVLSAYNPTFREKATDLLRGLLFSDDREGQRKAERLSNVLETITPYGVATGVDDAAGAFQQGDMATGGLMLGMAGLPGPSPKFVKNLKGQKIEAPKQFYRGTNPGDARRIKTGQNEWDSYLFAADNEPAARMYGSSIEQFQAAPDAKILYEGTAEWNKVAGRIRKDENLLQYADRAAKAAKAAGYDAAWFQRQGDVGTAIFNPAKFPSATPAPKGIRAFHGSPHSFDKFSMDKIGTGEGAQAYGHGLYFADSEGVAKSYREGLSIQQGQLQFPKFGGGIDLPKYKNTLALNGDDKSSEAARMFQDFLKAEAPGSGRGIHALNFGETTVKDQLDAFRTQIMSQKSQAGEQYSSFYDDVLEGIGTLERTADIDQPRAGSMYEVNINADPESFLDWDAPLSEQTPYVQQVLSKADTAGGSVADLEKAANVWRDALAKAEGKEPFLVNMYQTKLRMAEDRLRAARDTMTGQDVIRRNQGGLGGGKGSIEKDLAAAGIPGIKYLDAGSRAKGDGSRNYVVFDDKLISIVRKYGIAGASAMLGYNILDGMDPAQAAQLQEMERK